MVSTASLTEPHVLSHTKRRLFPDTTASNTYSVVDTKFSIAPEWGLLTRRVVWAYPATTRLVDALQSMHDGRITSPSLIELVTWLHSEHPTFTIELFLRGTEDVRRRVLDENGELQTEPLTDGSVFHAPTVFQLKAMLYHAGILTEREAEPNRLDPTTDVWQLCNPL